MKIRAQRTAEGIHLITVGQKANRLPQALWLKFPGLQENWEICKIGQWMEGDAQYRFRFTRR